MPLSSTLHRQDDKLVVDMDQFGAFVLDLASEPGNQFLLSLLRFLQLMMEMAVTLHMCCLCVNEVFLV